MASQGRIILLNKPFEVLTQFTDEKGRATLADYVDLPGVYAAGRLDYTSEGLLVLTDDGALQHRISDPKHKLPKTYWAQVEGKVDDQALEQLRAGVMLKDGMTRPAQAHALPELSEAGPWARVPPIRQRQHIPTSWLALTITEGRNRQVRRMTAAVGYPTLRLIRYSVGDWTIEGLAPGQWVESRV